MFSKRINADNQKRFYVFRLFLILLIVLTLGLLSSVRADPSGFKLEDYSGFYKPSRFIIGETIQLPDSITVEEIQMRVEKQTNSLLSSITQSSKNAEIGKTFLDNLSSIGASPKTETVPGSLGCHVITRSTRLDGAKVILKIEDSYRLGCGLTLSKKTTTFSLQKGEYDGEILYTTSDKRGRTLARYYFKRN